MKAVVNNNNFKKTLFWLVTIFLGIHIALASLTIFCQIDFLPEKVNAFYKKLIVLGPFFTDSRITTSPHLYISSSSPTGEWSAFQDIAESHFSNFQQQPWRYDELKRGDFERYLTLKAYPDISSLKKINGNESSSITELIRYINTLQKAQSDSIKLLYVWKVWRPKDQSIKTDTAFYVVFKPKINELAK